MAQHRGMTAKKKVLVALSGGVDSSVSAALLQEQGYEVEGAFIKTWTVPWLPCTWREERRDAMRVAAHLHIPFYTVDLLKEYEEKVANYLIEEYKKGRTPNPDVMCNKHIKFGGFFDWAMEKKYDYVATGHYARIETVLNDSDSAPYFHLLAGVDTNKDQTYFLWNLTQHHLAHTLFPVGNLPKPEVRKLAEHFSLPTAQKKDSQGICFLGKINMKEFLSHYIEVQKGDVLDTGGAVIGEHDGSVFLTLGQRHGFTVFQNRPDSPPLYVIEKNFEDNTVTVSEKNIPSKLPVKDITLSEVNWISSPIASCSARLRYRQKLFPVTLTNISNSSCTVTPDTPQVYVPEGQSVVLYNGEICLGGGIIG